jgi:hypothetical protein
MDAYITMHFETRTTKNKDNMPDFWEVVLGGILAIMTKIFYDVLLSIQANTRTVP